MAIKDPFATIADCCRTEILRVRARAEPVQSCKGAGYLTRTWRAKISVLDLSTGSLDEKVHIALVRSIAIECLCAER